MTRDELSEELMCFSSIQLQIEYRHLVRNLDKSIWGYIKYDPDVTDPSRDGFDFITCIGEETLDDFNYVSTYEDVMDIMETVMRIKEL